MKDLHFDATIATNSATSHQTALYYYEIGIHDSINARKEEMNGETTNGTALTMVEPIGMQYHQIVQTYLNKMFAILDQIINETSIITMMVTYMTIGIETFA